MTKIISLEEAVIQIKEACENNTPDNLPFFFIVGAGISCPPIPSSNDLVKEFKEKVGRINPEYKGPKSNSPMGVYSEWFEQAFHHRKDRQNFLRRKIEKKPISHANLRLAHLLSARQITNTVITPNFDDQLSRALNLFGISFVLCDHPSTTERINPEDEDIKIVHVHGTYWYYDCCNLAGEIDSRSKPSSKSTLTMPSLLDFILSRRSPLVLGYSGWENDVIMSSLKRRLEGRSLPYNLYWFCYRRNQINNLPEWLRDHQDVFFIAPPEEKAPEEKDMPAKEKEAIILPNEEESRELLTAEQVLDSLIEEFSLEPPELTQDPIGFFASHLEKSFLIEGMEEDIYSIKDVISTFRNAKNSLEQKITGEGNLLDDVRNAIRSSDFTKAVRVAKDIPIETLEESRKINLFELIWTASKGRFDNIEDELLCYKLLEQIYDLLKERRDLLDRVARALVNKGVALSKKGDLAEAVKAYEYVVSRFGNAEELELKKQVAMALSSKGFTFGKQGKHDEAVKAFEEVVSRFGHAEELELKKRVAKALVNKGVALSKKGDIAEAVKAYEYVVARFGNAEELELKELVAMALGSKGVTFGKQGKHDEAVKALEEVVSRFGNAEEQELKERVAEALAIKSFTFYKQGKHDETVKALEEVVSRFGNAEELELKERVAEALVNKGATFGEQGKHDEAVKAFEEVVSRFGDAEELELKERVAEALFNKGATFGEQGEHDEAVKAYEVVVSRFGNAEELELKKLVAAALFNKGFTFYKQGKHDEAVEAYEEVVSRFENEKDEDLKNFVEEAICEKKKIKKE
jgi:tetratricopeptide (TPR) repeat protein